MAKIAMFKSQMTQVHVMVSNLKTMPIKHVLERYRKVERQLPLELRWLRLSVMWEVFLDEKMPEGKFDSKQNEQN